MRTSKSVKLDERAGPLRFVRAGVYHPPVGDLGVRPIFSEQRFWRQFSYFAGT
jgi:hypothetical protein